MVLLVLVVIWAAVLLVPLVRAKADGTLGDSIGSFRRHLSVLERAAPTTVSPANRLRSPVGPVAIPPYRAPASMLPRPAPGMRRAPMGYPYAASPAALRRRQAQKRRRDVLFALLAGMFGSLLLGMIPGLGLMLWVFLLFVVMTAGYIALLVHMRNLVAERDMKMTFLPAPSAPAAYAGYGERRSATGTYGGAAGSYGELLAHRPAN